MAKAVIIYHSKTGITKRYADEIGKYLETKGIDVKISSIQAYKAPILDDADYVFLGCWTSGLMVILQHPEDIWGRFAAKLPDMPDVPVALFTTYKILTGSMFNNMRQQLLGKFTDSSVELKSRNGTLSQKDRKTLDHFIDQN